MRNALAALLLLAATAAIAAPTVTSIEPNVGFTFKPTVVTIHGSGFSQSEFDCTGPVNMPFCPAQVFFGPSGVSGTVLSATATTLTVSVPPRPHGEQGPVLVRLRDGSEGVLASGFRWDQWKTSNSAADYDRYLLPITTGRVEGANGSLWTTDWWVRNSTNNGYALIFDYCPPNVSPCPSPLLPPNETSRPTVVPRGDGNDGAFIYVPKPMRPSMTLRVRDLSQNAQSFGTELPVVRASDYRGTMEFLEVPTDPKYRATLRIYGPGPEPHSVIVAVFAEPSGELVERYDVELSGIVHAVPVEFPLHPAYAQLDPLTPAVRASGESVRIVVGSYAWWSLVSPPPEWPAYAFMTVTNNDTQQVTTITPKP